LRAAPPSAMLHPPSFNPTLHAKWTCRPHPGGFLAPHPPSTAPPPPLPPHPKTGAASPAGAAAFAAGARGRGRPPHAHVLPPARVAGAKHPGQRGEEQAAQPGAAGAPAQVGRGAGCLTRSTAIIPGCFVVLERRSAQSSRRTCTGGSGGWLPDQLVRHYPWLPCCIREPLSPEQQAHLHRWMCGLALGGGRASFLRKATGMTGQRQEERGAPPVAALHRRVGDNAVWGIMVAPLHPLPSWCARSVHSSRHWSIRLLSPHASPLVHNPCWRAGSS